MGYCGDYLLLFKLSSKNAKVSKESVVMLKKNKKLLCSTIYSLPCQSSPNVQESTTMHACGAADAGAGVWSDMRESN